METDMFSRKDYCAIANCRVFRCFCELADRRKQLLLGVTPIKLTAKYDCKSYMGCHPGRFLSVRKNRDVEAPLVKLQKRRKVFRIVAKFERK